MFLPEGNASAKALRLEGTGFKESRKSLCGWSIASKGHSFIEVVGDPNWAKSWGYLLDHVDIWAPHCSTRTQKWVMSRIRYTLYQWLPSWCLELEGGQKGSRETREKMGTFFGQEMMEVGPWLLPRKAKRSMWAGAQEEKHG